MKTVAALAFSLAASVAVVPGRAADGDKGPTAVLCRIRSAAPEIFVDATSRLGLGDARRDAALESLSNDQRAPELGFEASGSRGSESGPTNAQDETDREIACQIAERLRRYVFYTIHDDVKTAVEKGVVELGGWATSPLKAQQIAEMAASVPGVLGVRNSIEVLPGSSDRSRSRMRGEIAAGIYTDKQLRSYAFSEEPIRIIVQDASWVILRGVVRSGEDKRRAERIARSVFGVLWVVNDLRVEPIEPNSTGPSCR